MLIIACLVPTLVFLLSVGASRAADITSCVGGTYLKDGVCEPCERGYKCLNGIRTSCDTNTTSLPQSTECFKCPSGTYLVGVECQLCQAGSKCDGISKETCADGYYSSSEGYGSCIPCPAGYKCTKSSKTVCPPNEYSLGGQSTCTPVPTNSGFISTSQEPVKCKPGQYFVQEGGVNICKPCEIDHYCPNGIDIEPCKRGYYSEEGFAECSICPKGYSCSNGVLTQCDESKSEYSDKGSTVCAVAQEGYHYTDIYSTPRVCKDGYEYSDHKCSPCEEGYACTTQDNGLLNGAIITKVGCTGRTYSLAGQSSCTDMPANYYVDDLSAIHKLSDLHICSIGFYVENNTCKECPSGYACKGDGGKEECGTGFINAGGGLSYCVPKNQNLGNGYNPNVYFNNNDEGVQCPEGQIANADKTGCVEPSGNAISISVYTTNTITCPDGFYASDGKTCTPCPANHSCKNGVQTRCQNGTFSPEGASECTKCQSFEKCMWNNDAIERNPCSYGTYLKKTETDGVASYSCEPCPAGSSCISLNGYVSCHNNEYSSTEDMECHVCNQWTDCESTPTSENNGFNYCPPGFYINSDGVCTVCPQGSYCNKSTSNGIESCPPGTYNYSEGSAWCLLCPAGHYCSGGTSEPQECPDGTYSPKDDFTTTCTSCPGGYDCSDKITPVRCPQGTYRHGQICKACEKGYYCPGDTQEHQCPERSYSDSEGSIFCSICPSNAVCNQGCTKPVYCNQGYVLKNNSCVKVEDGSIVTGSTTFKCSEGYYAFVGDSVCRLCPRGHYCEYDSASGTYKLPVPCPKGTYAFDGSSECTAVPVNYTTNGLELFACPRGFIYDQQKKTCKPCPAGSKCPTQSEKVTCAQNEFSLDGFTTCISCAGANSNGYKCLDSTTSRIEYCQPGNYLKEGNCTECEAGSYCPDGTNKEACPKGHVSEKGQTECQRCLFGTHVVNNKCTFCDPHQYSLDGDECINYPRNYESTRHDGTSHLERWVELTVCISGYMRLEETDTKCVPCPSGKSCNITVRTVTDCPANTYSQSGELICIKNPLGHAYDSASDTFRDCNDISDQTGKAMFYDTTTHTCKVCPANHFCPNALLNVQCAKGYKSVEGSFQCEPCGGAKFCTFKDDGTFEEEACNKDGGLYYYCPKGFPGRIRCPPGTMGDGNNACTPCPAGYYCSDTRPVKCPPGYTCPEGTKYKFDSPCQDGLYVPEQETTKIPDVSNPQWNTVNHTITCEICPAGSYCPLGTSEPKPCEPGFYCPQGTRNWFNYKCPAGRYAVDSDGNSITGIESEADCGRLLTICSFGYYCPPGSGDKTPCPVGRYGDKEGAKVVTDCPPCKAGYSCPAVGLYFKSDGHTIFPCGLGHYCPPGTKFPDQFPCPEGTYGTSTSLKSIQECSSCGAGYMCPEGSYSSGSDSSTVDTRYSCPRGHYCPELEATITGIDEQGNEISVTYKYTQVIACPAGTYNKNRGAMTEKNCLPCPPGSYCVEGASTPTGMCPAGYYCPEGTKYPMEHPCPIDTYNELEGLKAEKECKTCPGGYSCAPGTVEPIACPGGTYRPYGYSNGMPSDSSDFTQLCYPCPAGFFCPEGSFLPYVCNRGTYSKEEQDECTFCEVGHYCSKTDPVFIKVYDGSKEVQLEGEFGVTETEMEGLICGDGTYCPLGTDHEPLKTEPDDMCPKGYYCNSETNSLPVSCPPGTYDSKNMGLAASSECTPCPKGSYCEGGNTHVSGKCEPGYYCPEGSSTSKQETCPPGTYGSSYGLEEETDCEECNEGYYCPLSSFTGTQCPQGYYCGKGVSEPSPCPQGTYSGNAGLKTIDQCTKCPPGMYCSGIGLTKPSGLCESGYICTGGATTATPTDKATEGGHVCSKGYFCMQGTSREVPCSPGYYNPYEKGTSLDSCLPCPGGYFCDGSGVYNLDEEEKIEKETEEGTKVTINIYKYKCEAGFYCTGMATTSRQFMTPPGSYTKIGATEPILCEPGTRQPRAGQSECIPCGEENKYDDIVGGYCPDYGMVDPYPCPKGSSCSTVPAKSYTPCEKGKYNNQESFGKDQCIPCPPGRVCSRVGISEFSDTDFCLAGYYCREMLTTSHPTQLDASIGGPCPKGHYCPKNTFDPLPCPPGTYNSYTGRSSISECMVCPPGKVCSRSGLTEPDGDCAEGYYCVQGAYISTPTDRVTGDICQPGYYCPEGSSSQTLCNSGSYTDEFGQSECAQCPEGYYCPGDKLVVGTVKEGNTGEQTGGGAATVFIYIYRTKLPCPRGHYCGAQATKSLPCPKGTFLPTELSTTINDCLACLPGMYCPDEGMATYLVGGEIQKCSAGYVCESGCADEKCTSGTNYVGKICPVGHYCPEGTPYEIKCPAGTYNMKTGGTGIADCLACPDGHYCIEGESTNGKPCNEGYYCRQYENVYKVSETETYTIKLGASVPNPTDGLSGNICPMGYNCPMGCSVPTKTPKGFYKDYFGVFKQEESKCPAGYYCPPGTSYYKANVCAKGFYCPKGSSTANAMPCKASTYSNRTGLKSADECTKCPGGFFCNSTEDTTKPTGKCAAGYYCLTSATSSTPATATKKDFGLGEDDSSPINGRCPEGYYCPEGSSRPVICKSGHYCPNGSGIPTQCLAGDYCPQGSNGTTRIECPVGHYCPLKSALPIPCPIGTYNDKTGEKTINGCLPCPEGFACMDVGLTSDEMEECEEGFYCPKGSFSTANPEYICQPGHMCPAGSSNQIKCPDKYYQDKYKQAECEICPAGYTCKNACVVPTICPAGSYCPKGSDSEIKCPISTYNPTKGMESIDDCLICPGGFYCDNVGLSGYTDKKCPEDHYCPPGTTKADYSKNICPKGSYCPEGSYLPRKCPVGTKNDKTRSTSIDACVECSAGSYCDQEGLQVEKGKCASGYYCVGGSTSRTPKDGICPEGTYCPEGSKEPINCKPGTYNPMKGQSSCLPCPAGFTCDEESITEQGNTKMIGATRPTICPEGSYCPEKLRTPITCPDGTYGHKEGLHSRDECLPCPAGRYCTGGAIQGQCSAGKWCITQAAEATPENSRVNKYVDCPKGYTCETGTVVPTPCSPGFYKDEEGSGECEKCPAGRACDKYGMVSSQFGLQCAAGFFCVEESTTNTPESGACTEGHYCPKGSVEEQKCEPGYYSDTSLAKSCKQCPSGYYCDAQGMSIPTPCTDVICPLGTKSENDEGLVKCSNGTYNPTGALTSLRECKACLPGSACINGEVEPCSEGYVCSIHSSSTKPAFDKYNNMECPQGFYCPASSSAPLPCLPGTFNSNSTATDNTSCTLCTAGQYCGGLGLSSPSGSCYEGFYCDVNSITPTASACGRNTKCPSGSGGPVKCNNGEYAPEMSDQCYTCPEGYYCNWTDGESNLPQPCTEGHYCPAGTIDPKPCPAGTYLDQQLGGNVRHCKKCPEGYKCPSEGQASYSEKCLAGHYCREGTANDEIKCPLGSYCPEGSPSPIKCPVGSIGAATELTAESDCSSCPAGKYCSKRGMTTSVDNCSAGFYCPENEYIYEPRPADFVCPEGHYCPLGSNAPIPCKPGTYAHGKGNHTCSPCPMGTYCDKEKTINPKTCTAGNYCPTNTITPIPCPDGLFGLADIDDLDYKLEGLQRSDQCIECPPGYYCQGGMVKGKCTAGYVCKTKSSTPTPNNLMPIGTICDRGYYCKEGAKFMAPCKDGTWSKKYGATRPEECDPCDAGYYCVGGNRIPCEPGHYCTAGEKEGELTVHPCPEGTYNDKEGMATEDSCLPCPPGYLCDSTGISNYKLRLCPKGHYCLQGSIKEKTCPGGTYRPEYGGKSEEDCEECEKGFYCPEGSFSMIQCIPGQYCPAGSAQPTICPPGTIWTSSTKVHETLEDTCLPCEAGHYCDGTDGITMKVCSAGYICLQGAFKPNPELTDEKGYICPKGHWCASGALSPTPCTIGQYSDNLGNESADMCQPCPTGTYNDQEGSDTCVTCGQSAIPIRTSKLLSIIEDSSIDSSHYGADNCKCYGKNRTYKGLTSECSCFVGYTTNDNTDSNGDGLSDCVPIIYPLCGKDQTRYLTGQCTTNKNEGSDHCKDNCLGGEGSVIGGLCECNNFGNGQTIVLDIDSVCDSHCRRSGPVIRLNSENYQLSFDELETLSFQTLDVNSEISAETTLAHGQNIISFYQTPGSEPSYLYTYNWKDDGKQSLIRYNTRCNSSFECRTYLVTVGFMMNPEGNTLAPYPTFAGFYEYNNENLIKFIKSSALGDTPSISMSDIFESENAMYNPILCLEADQSLLFLHPQNNDASTNRYVPIYLKESLFNTNKDYDSSFWTWEERKDSLVSIYSFPDPGIYTFGIADINNPDSFKTTSMTSYDGSILIVRVMPPSASCSLVQPINVASTYNLTRMGISMERSITERGKSVVTTYEIIKDTESLETNIQTNNIVSEVSPESGSLLVAPNFGFLAICAFIMIVIIILIIFIIYWIALGGFNRKLQAPIIYTETMSSQQWRSLSPTALLPIVDNRRTETEIRMRINPATAILLEKGQALPKLDDYDPETLRKIYWGGYSSNDLPQVPSVTLHQFDVSKFAQTVINHQKSIMNRMNGLNRIASDKMAENINKLAYATEILSRIDSVLEKKTNQAMHKGKTMVPLEEMTKYMNFLDKQRDAIITILEGSGIVQRKAEICFDALYRMLFGIHKHILSIESSPYHSIEAALEFIQSNLRNVPILEKTVYETIDSFIAGLWNSRENVKPNPKASSKKRTSVVSLLMNLEFGKLYQNINQIPIGYDQLLDTSHFSDKYSPLRAKEIPGVTYRDPQTGLVHPSYDPPTFIITTSQNATRDPIMIDNPYLSRHFCIEPNTGFLLPTACSVFFDREQSTINKPIIIHLADIINGIQTGLITNYSSIIKNNDKNKVHNFLEYLTNRFLPFVPSPNDLANIYRLMPDVNELVRLLRTQNKPFIVDSQSGLRVPVIGFTILNNSNLKSGMATSNTNSPIYPICGIYTNGITQCTVPLEINSPLLKGQIFDSIDEAMMDIEREKNNEDILMEEKEHGHIEPIIGIQLLQDGSIQGLSEKRTDIFGNPSFAALGMPSLCYQANSIMPLSSVVSINNTTLILTGGTNSLYQALLCNSIENALKAMTQYASDIASTYNDLLKAYTDYQHEHSTSKYDTSVNRTIQVYKRKYGSSTVAKGLRNVISYWPNSGLLFDNYWNSELMEIDVVKDNVSQLAETGNCPSSTNSLIFPYIDIQSEENGLSFIPPRSNTNIQSLAPISINELSRLKKVYSEMIETTLSFLHGSKDNRNSDQAKGIEELLKGEDEQEMADIGINSALNQIYQIFDEVQILMAATINCIDSIDKSKCSQQPRIQSSQKNKISEYITENYAYIKIQLSTLKELFNYINNSMKSYTQQETRFQNLSKNQFNTFELISKHAQMIYNTSYQQVKNDLISKLKDCISVFVKSISDIIETDEACMGKSNENGTYWSTYTDRANTLTQKLESVEKEMKDRFKEQINAKVRFNEMFNRSLSSMNFVLNRCILVQQELFNQPLLFKMCKEGTANVYNTTTGVTIRSKERDHRFMKSIEMMLDLMLKSDNPNLVHLKELAKDYARRVKELNPNEHNPFDEEDFEEPLSTTQKEFDIAISKAQENEVVDEIIEGKSTLINELKNMTETLQDRVKEQHDAQNKLITDKNLNNTVNELRKQSNQFMSELTNEVNNTILESVDNKIKNSTLFEELSRLNNEQMRSDITRSSTLNDEIRRIEKTNEAQINLEMSEFEKEAEVAKTRLLQQLQIEFKKQEELVPSSELKQVVEAHNMQLDEFRSKFDQQTERQRQLLIDRLNAKKAASIADAKIKHNQNQITLQLQKNETNINKELSEINIKANDSKINNEKQLLEEYSNKLAEIEAELTNGLNRDPSAAIEKYKKSLAELQNEVKEKRGKFENELKENVEMKQNNWNNVKQQNIIDINNSLVNEIQHENECVAKAKEDQDNLDELVRFEKEQVEILSEAYKTLAQNFVNTISRAEEDESVNLCKEYIGTANKLLTELKVSEQDQRSQLEERIKNRKKKTSKQEQESTITETSNERQVTREIIPSYDDTTLNFTQEKEDKFNPITDNRDNFKELTSIADDIQAKIYQIDTRPLLKEGTDVDGIIETQLNAVGNLKKVFQMDEIAQRKMLEERRRAKKQMRKEHQAERIKLMQEATAIEEKNKQDASTANELIEQERVKKDVSNVGNVELILEEKNLNEISNLQTQFNIEVKNAMLDCEDEIYEQYDKRFNELREAQTQELKELFMATSSNLDTLLKEKVSMNSLNNSNVDKIDAQYIEITRKHKRMANQLTTEMNRDLRDMKEKRSQELKRKFVQQKSALIRNQINEKTKLLAELYPSMFGDEDKLIERKKKDTEKLRQKLLEEREEMEKRINEEIEQIGIENMKRIEEETRRIESEFDEMLRQEILKTKQDQEAINNIKKQVIATEKPAQEAQQIDIPSLEELSSALNNAVSTQLTDQQLQLKRRIDEMKRKKAERLQKLQTQVKEDINQQIQEKELERDAIEKQLTVDETLPVTAGDEDKMNLEQSESGDIMEEPSPDNALLPTDQKEFILQKVSGRIDSLGELIAQLREFNITDEPGIARVKYVDEFDKGIRNEGILSVADNMMLTSEELQGLSEAQKLLDWFKEHKYLGIAVEIKAATHLPETNYAEIGNTYPRSFYYQQQDGHGVLYLRTERLTSPLLKVIVCRCVAHVKLNDWSDENPLFQREFNRCINGLRKAMNK